MPAMNTTEQTTPQVKTPWQYEPQEPVYTSTQLPRPHARIEWRDFRKRLGDAAWIWLAVVVRDGNVDAATRESFIWRVRKLGGPELTVRQIEKQLAKLYRLGLVTNSDTNPHVQRRRNRTTEQFTRGRVQERTALGGAIFADGEIVAVGLPLTKYRGVMQSPNHGGVRAGAGRPRKQTAKLDLIVKPPGNTEATAEELELVQNIVRLAAKNAAITANQVVSPAIKWCHDCLRQGFSTLVFQGSEIGIVLALKILTDLFSSLDQSTDSSDRSRFFRLFPFSDEKGKKTTAGKTGGDFLNFFFPEGEIILRSDQVINQSSVGAINPSPTIPAPASSPLGEKEQLAPAPAEPVKVEPDCIMVRAEQALARIKARAKAGPPADGRLQPGDEGWRPVLSLWPTVPLPTDWDRLSTVDALAAAYLVRLYTAYREAKGAGRWWFKGKAQAQPWWKRAQETAHALREAGISPGAWVAWVDGALWPSKGPAPHSMVLSPTLVTKHQAWCRSTFEDYLFRPTQVPPSMRELWQEWKKAQKEHTANNPVVIARFRRLQEQAEVEAVAMQEGLRAQVREGRWVW